MHVVVQAVIMVMSFVVVRRGGQEQFIVHVLPSSSFDILAPKSFYGYRSWSLDDLKRHVIAKLRRAGFHEYSAISEVSRGRGGAPERQGAASGGVTRAMQLHAGKCVTPINRSAPHPPLHPTPPLPTLVPRTECVQFFLREMKWALQCRWCGEAPYPNPVSWN